MSVGPGSYGRWMDVDVGALSDDQLVHELRSWAARTAAGEALVLRLLGELDAREAWGAAGVLSCAHWASWQLGLSLATARERVRVARCLRELPLLSAELEAGRVSYAQVRAVTRVATPSDEQQWVELAHVTSAAQLEKAVRGVSRARREATPIDAETRDREAHRSASTWWDDEGTLVVTLRVPAAHAPAVLAALESAQRQEQADRDELYARLAAELVEPSVREAGDASAEGPAPPVSGSPSPHAAADALAAMPCPPPYAAPPYAAPPYAAPYEYEEPAYPVPASRGLFELPTEAERAAMRAFWEQVHERKARAAAARAWSDHLQAMALAAELPAPRATLADGLIRALTRPQGLPAVTVTLLVDPLSGWARTGADELLPPRTVQRAVAPSHLSARPLLPADLTCHDAGRTSRLVTPALRRLLGQLDGERCRFPSCTRTRNLHAHHVRHWRDGGPTDLANLALVCSRHHTVLHERGFRLELGPDRLLTVRTRDGVPVPSRPRRPLQVPGDLHRVPAGAPTLTGDPLDLSHVVWVMARQAA